jgi:DNA polymerase III sliding clamp (beta) subunit (PCNA family)
MKVLQEIVKASNFISKDETRRYLQGVKITKDGRIIATDGMKLYSNIIKDFKIDEDIFIHLDKEIIKIIKAWIKSFPVLSMPTLKDGYLQFTDMVKLPYVDALRFPDKIDQVIECKQEYSFSIDLDQLKEIIKSIDDKKKIVEFHVNSELNPIKLMHKDRAVRVVMPVRRS